MRKTSIGILMACLCATALAQTNSENAASVSADNLKRGLVLHFDFDSPPNGDKVIDLSGDGNDGQAVNIQWTADGHQGGGMQFGLSNSYIAVPNNASLNPPQYTLCAWIRTSYQDGIFRRLIDKGCGDYDLTMAGDTSKGRYLRGRVAFQPGSNWVSCSTIVADGQWHHCVGVFNGRILRLYLDGHLRWSAFKKGGCASFGYDLTIGANRHPISVYDQMNASLNGALDDVMIYNRALSGPEVRALFESQGGVWVDLPPPANSAPSRPSAADRLKELESLYQQGLINQDDYKRKKKEILDSL
ncbi:MAG TPA: LamG-like jellyroll fold domain-containing protein [Verrucomicrobiae bacterium]|nr:LamG-like jellyroll fold domain-containing protein [Verrucomicrobiae bacterium]